MGRVDTDLCGGSPAGGECWGGTTPQAPSGASDQEDGAEGRVSSPRPPEGAMVRAEPSPHRGQGPRLPCLGSTKQSPQQAFPGLTRCGLHVVPQLLSPGLSVTEPQPLQSVFPAALGISLPAAGRKHFSKPLFLPGLHT